MNRVALILSLAAVACGCSSTPNGPTNVGGRDAAVAPDGTTPGPDTGAPEAGSDSEPADAGGDATASVCPPGITNSFNSILSTMLATSSCGTDRPYNCHSATGASPQGTGNLLDFTASAATVYKELLGPAGTGRWAANLQGTARVEEVVPGDASASFLYIKLQLPTAMDPQYGECMPVGSPNAVCPAALDAVRYWIEQGAVQN
jgi:hypothetical protein